jgi:UDP-3-O-[3-hydroxymyristoyl] N-acetylglucosamine deacetylase/3-hydroxyacyl-[acyl-carrier-protein] dehydratase
MCNCIFQKNLRVINLLDIVGDFALVGCRLRHTFLLHDQVMRRNVEFAKKVKQLIKRDKGKTQAPAFDLTGTPASISTALQNIYRTVIHSC